METMSSEDYRVVEVIVGLAIGLVLMAAVIFLAPYCRFG